MSNLANNLVWLPLVGGTNLAPILNARGIRIGYASTGQVIALINSDAEFVASDRTGNIYGAHVPGQALVKHEKVR